MDEERRVGNEEATDEQAAQEAPSPRARALREEILGAALSLEEAAYVLSLDRTTVAKYLREGTIFGFQIGREWRVPEDELRAYVRRSIEGQKRHAIDAPGRNLIERIRGDLFAERRKGPKADADRMSTRFDKFTKRARHVLTLAQEEATSFQHNYIGTEHLLLGLAREGDGVAARVLLDLGVQPDRIRSAVEFIIGRGDRPVSGEVGLTPRSKKVMELAVDEARRLGHHYIGTEHLLLGLLREGEGIAAGVLQSLDVSLDRVRTHTIQVLSGMTHEASAPPPPVPAEAATLVADGQEALICPRCSARNPRYFHHCFNCGANLAGADESPAEPVAE